MKSISVAQGGALGPLAEAVNEALSEADVRIGGDRPWDPQVRDRSVYAMAARADFLGLGEAYVRGDWDCEDVAEMVSRLGRAELHMKSLPRVRVLLDLFAAWLEDGGSRAGARKVATTHYDLGNDLYRAMLDPRMVYSCGYWAHADNLADAQEAKLDLACRKLQLRPGLSVLDVGCGWGSFAKFAAERYGARVVGVTVSKEQKELADEACADLPVEIRLQDYRDVEGRFDRVVSIGMFEHVGPKNYRTYMAKVRQVLKEDGIFMLHCIGSSLTGSRTNPWIDKFIFPGGYVPSLKQMAQAVEDGAFVMEDWHNFGPDYDKTLCAWFERFDANWSKLKDRFPADFYRRWKLYLLGCAGGFRSRQLQVWQIVLSPHGIPGGYRAAR